jgi:uncharacterized RDD family membrane protein YckC
VTANPRQRILAALIDIGWMLAWAAFVALMLWAVALAGVAIRLGPFGYNLFSMLLVVLPVTLALTLLEAGRYEATPGKHLVGLRVRRDPSGERVGWGRSLVRNLLKLGLPWALGQFAILAVVTSPAPDAALGALIALVVPAVFLASLFLDGGHTIYDWLTGTTVITVAAGRRFADPGPESVAEDDPPTESWPAEFSPSA